MAPDKHTAITKPPPPQSKRTISQVSMTAVVMAPLTEEEADQITLFMLPGGMPEDGEVQCKCGEEEVETIFLRGPQGRDLRSPFERALLLFDAFQSADNKPTILSESHIEDVDLAFAEHHTMFQD
jgi:hypothetical protein